MIAITHWDIHAKKENDIDSFDYIHMRWMETQNGLIYPETWVVGEQTVEQQAFIDIYEAEGILPNWEQYLPPNPQIPAGPTFQRLD